MQLSFLLLVAAIAIGSTSSFVLHNDKNAASFMRHRPQHAESSSTSLRMEELECDVAIVGGGPAGCTCALYTSRAQLDTVILDKNPAVGALAITSHIANYPGVDRSMSGAELLEQMKVQAVQYGTRYERAQVFMIDTNDDATEENPYTKLVYTPDYVVKARALVLATGAMGRASPPYPGEEEYLGQGVSYCATCDGAFYQDAPVAVFGATGEAIEEALFLTKFASTVHWISQADMAACITRQNSLPNNVECNAIVEVELIEELLSKPNVKHYNKARFKSVEGDASGVTGVKIQTVGQKEEELIEVEGAFIYGAGGGSKPITDFCQSKVDLDESGGVIVDADMATSAKGRMSLDFRR